ncbi:MAG: flagellar hook-length control protein FliK, partial [Sporolactobacillus sp.]
AASVTNKSPLPVQSQAAASTPIMELSAGQLLQTSQWQGRGAEEKVSPPAASGQDAASVTNKSPLPVQSQAAASTPIMELSAGQLLQTSQWQGRGAEEKVSPPAAFAHEDVDTDASGKQAVLSSATTLGRDQFSDSAASIQNTIAGHQMNRIALWHDYQVAAQDAPSVPEQVADQMTKWLNHSSLQLGENGIKSMTMTLYPENLGTVTIMVTQDHTGITASLSADTQSAKDILKSGIEQLQKSLISQGLPIHQIDVAHKNEPAQQNQSSSNPDQAQQQARQGSQGEQEQQRSQDQKRYSASRSDLTEEKQDFHQLIIERSV